MMYTYLHIATVVAVSVFALLALLIYVFLFRKNILRTHEPQTIYVQYKPLCTYNEQNQDGADWFLSLNPDKVTITSFDGLKLTASFLPAQNGESQAKGTVLLMHGFHSFGLRDFAAVVRFYHDEKYNILLPDQRAHGKSEGRFITFGIRERFDCRSWILYANKRAASAASLLPLFLHGDSMGATTVLMTAGFDLPPNVKGIIADSGFTSPYEEMKHVLKTVYHLPVFPTLPIAGLLIRLFAGFALKEYSTITAMKTNKIPTAFIHGEDDTFVPSSMSKRNYEACKAEKSLILVPNAEHVMSYYLEPERLQNALHDFLETHSAHIENETAESANAPNSEEASTATAED